jgi:phenylpropionate dioxygenase-like ring-hydroxylating dioxygenase large terminal subunit
MERIAHNRRSALQGNRVWKEGVLTRVPYWLFEDQDIYRAEQERIYRGPTWTFLCLEAEIRNPGDYRTVSIGDMPVVVVRDDLDAIHAFENRCVHRGALIAYEDGGNAKTFTCIYHNWNYDRRGNLKSIAFQRGVQGKGGMPNDFRVEDHRPMKVRTARFHGLVFGTVSEATPSIEDFLGDEVGARIARVMHKPVEVLGRFKQTLPNNWKLFLENTRDSYHASLLHAFFTTFRLNRLSQKGGLIVSPGGDHAVNFSALDRSVPAPSEEYDAEQLRSDVKNFGLVDPSLLQGFDEFPDGITLQVVSVFPGFAIAQVRNTLAVRRIIPRGVHKTDLHWTYMGYTDDTAERRAMRLKQLNLVGPAGYVSLEDGMIGGFIQRGIAAASNEEGIIEMGGDSTASQDTRATEGGIRGLYRAYRRYMGI